MPTLLEIRSSILGQLTGQVPTDDQRLLPDFIDHEIRIQRALLLARITNRGLGVDQGWYSRLSCLEVQCGNLQCAGIDSGIQQTYVELPPLAPGKSAITYLGTLDGRIQFDRLSLTAFNLWDGGRLKKSHPLFTVLDGKAILKCVPSGLKYVLLVALLEDPAQNTCLLDFENELYPIPGDQVRDLEFLVLRQLLPTLPIAPDVINDGANKTAEGRPALPQ